MSQHEPRRMTNRQGPHHIMANEQGKSASAGKRPNRQKGHQPGRQSGSKGPRRPRSAPQQPGFLARKAALTIVTDVLDKQVLLDEALSDAIQNGLLKELDQRDRALTRAIAAMTLRRFGQIRKIMRSVMERPLPTKAGQTQRILETALAQILYMDIADHAAVDLAVRLADSMRQTRPFKNLVNGVLRRIVREKETMPEPEIYLNTPKWLWERWVKTYGEDLANRIVASHLVEPGLDLVMREGPNAVETWAKRLDNAIILPGEYAVRTIPDGPIEAMPGYRQGEWWVQDLAASLPITLIGNVERQRVADICAAPGGKTAGLIARGANVTAIDISAHRLKRLDDNLQRLKFKAEIVETDYLTYDPAIGFDKILLDAPCSATGTVRKHPDLPFLKNRETILELAALQARMLDHAANMIARGGTLVYCTCSLEPEEGEDQIAAFLARNPAFSIDPVQPEELPGLEEVIREDGTVRTLPCHFETDRPRLSGLDGFFIARLHHR